MAEEDIDNLESVLPSASPTFSGGGIDLSDYRIILLIAAGCIVTVCLLLIIIAYLILAISSQVKKKKVRAEYAHYRSGSQIVRTREMEFESIEETEDGESSEDSESMEDEEREEQNNEEEFKELPPPEEEDITTTFPPSQLQVPIHGNEPDPNDAYDDYDDDHIYEVPPDAEEGTDGNGRGKKRRARNAIRLKNGPLPTRFSHGYKVGEENMKQEEGGVVVDEGAGQDQHTEESMEEEEGGVVLEEGVGQDQHTDEDEIEGESMEAAIDKSLEDIRKSLDDIQGALND